MKRTKLERYVEIIGILQRRGPLKLSQFSTRRSIDSQELKEDLDFLAMNSIIVKYDSDGSQVYEASAIGNKITKYFGQPTVKLQA